MQTPVPVQPIDPPPPPDDGSGDVYVATTTAYLFALAPSTYTPSTDPASTHGFNSLHGELYIVERSQMDGTAKMYRRADDTYLVLSVL